MRASFVAVLTILLVSCRQEPAPREQANRPAPAPPPPAAAVQQDTRPVIVAFGDSLTAGFGVDPGRSYADFLQKELDSRGYRYRVVNAGISGDTTSDGLARISTVIAEKPEIVILELGANDGLRGVPVKSTRANLERIITELKQSGARVVLAGMTLPPNYGPEYIRSFENVFKHLAREHQLALIPFFLEGVGGVAEMMQRDGLHPTVEGNRRVAATVMKTLEPLLEK
jgi:acyl-CoA thioesterase-1